MQVMSAMGNGSMNWWARWGKWMGPVRPAFQSRYPIEFSAEESHVAVLASSKACRTNDILIVDSLCLFRGYIFGQVDPDCILVYVMLEVLAMKVNRISFKFKVQKSKHTNDLVVIGLRVGDELYQTYLFCLHVWTTLGVVSGPLRKCWQCRQKENKEEAELDEALHAKTPCVEQMIAENRK
jgi:hypothetical protein